MDFTMFTVSNKDKYHSVQVNVSPEDFNDVQKLKWYMSDESNKCYIRTFINRKMVQLHHYIYSRVDPEFKGLPLGYVIDHKDNNPCNNCRENLRMVSHSLNSHNRKKSITERTTSKYKGVGRGGGSENSWGAKYSNVNLGSYKTEKEAAKAYDRYVIALHGIEHASHNDVLQDQEISELNSPDTYVVQPKCANGYGKCTRADGSIVFEARIGFHGKNRYIGTYATEVDAQAAYVETKVKLLEEEKQRHFGKHIERNEQGIAIITGCGLDGKVKGYTLVDDDRWHDLSQYKWSINRKGYWAGKVNGKGVLLHRYVLNVTDPYIPVDHIDGNKSDNRTTKLRESNPNHNAHNRRKQNGTTSKYIGVHKIKGSDTYVAYISYKCSLENLGLFCTEGLAALAYNKRAAEIYGDAANLNTISKEDIEPTPYQALSRFEKKHLLYKKKDGKSKYIGVSMNDSGRYTAVVTKDKINHYCGIFDTELEAAVAYNKKCRELYRDIANLNNVDESIEVNRRVKKKNSEYNGVSYDTKKQKYYAFVQLNGKKKQIGSFLDEKDAARAYNKYMADMYGPDHPALNPVEGTLDYIPVKYATGKECTSKYRGVTLYRANGKYRATFCLNKKKIVIGAYATEEEAAMAYNTKAKEMLGDKAKLNIL